MASKTAISLGANIIERHFTLDKRMEGPDHLLSSDKEEMANLVQFKKNYRKFKKWFKNLRINDKKTIKIILGDGVKKIQPNEYITINSQKKSLYAKTIIKKGEKFSNKNIIVKGPAGGLLPKYINVILNRKSISNIEKDQPITWSDF